MLGPADCVPILGQHTPRGRFDQVSCDNCGLNLADADKPDGLHLHTSACHGCLSGSAVLVTADQSAASCVEDVFSTTVGAASEVEEGGQPH